MSVLMYKNTYIESYPTNERKVFVSPEVTDPKKISILHFPTESLKINQKCEFTVKKNDAKGNVEAQVAI